jgi:hypothetical protein
MNNERQLGLRVALKRSKYSQEDTHKKRAPSKANEYIDKTYGLCGKK